jgi:hypothetical protein
MILLLPRISKAEDNKQIYLNIIFIYIFIYIVIGHTWVMIAQSV